MTTFNNLDFGKYPDQLMPVVTQDASTGEMLMLAFANKQALEETMNTGLATYWSRSRNELWTKGKTSGDTLEIIQNGVRTDCDRDALLYLVEPQGSGGACHIDGWKSCFGSLVSPEGVVSDSRNGWRAWSCVLRDEERMLQALRKNGDPQASYTAGQLQGTDLSRLAQKVGEEGVEIALAAMNTLRSSDNDDAKNKLIAEVADMMYRLQVLLVKIGIDWSQVEQEIVQRRQ